MLFESERLRLGLDDGIATLWLGAEATRNVIGRPFLHDLAAVIAMVERSPVIDVLVVRSGVPGVFACGPDLEELVPLDDVEARLEHAALGQRVLRRLADLSSRLQTVAVIEGRCSNAGLELALACAHRLAVASSEATFVFDGIRRGVLPCWGGSVLLPKTVGLKAALDLLAGTPLPARAAQRIGLVDRVVGARQARTELLWYLAELQDLQRRPRPHGGARSFWQRLRELPMFSRTIMDRARRTYGSDTIAHAVLDTVQHGWRVGADEGMCQERRAFATVLGSADSLRRQAGARRSDRRVHGCRNARLPDRVVMVGYDDTNMELAALALQAGSRVRILAKVPAARQRGEVILRQALDRAAAAGWINALDVAALVADTFGDDGAGSFCENDLVLAADRSAQGPAALLTLESTLPATALLVSLAPLPKLTSSFQQPARCLALKTPGRFSIGSSVDLRPLPVTSADVLARLVRWLDHCGLRIQEVPAVSAEVRAPAVFAA